MTDSTTVLTPDAADKASTPKPAGVLHDLVRSPRFVVAGTAVLLMVTMALFPALFTGIDARDPSTCQQAVGITSPGGQHWFGTDAFGCDYYSKVVYGARPSIAIGLMVTIGSFLISAVLGSLAGYFGGWVDALISRICDMFFGIPFILGAIVVLQSFDSRSVVTVGLALTAFYWPGGVRYMRSGVLKVRNAEYVEAARVLGAGNARILARHVVPNSLTPLLVLKTLGVGGVIAAEAGLTFIGVGLEPPAISWGLQLAAAKPEISQNPHLLLFPSLFLSVTVLAFVLAGEAVRDALDPKAR